MPAKTKRNSSITFETIQRFLLYIFIAILPIFILPFPWDFTEKGMTILLLLFTLLILSIELVKILWSGKILFLKRDTDLIIFLLLISFVLTTVFSRDTNLSIFGYDYRLSGGLLGLGSVLLLTFFSRSFLSTKKDLLNLLNCLFIGSILTSFFSIISLFGGNVFGLIPKLGELGIEGFPILGSPMILAIYNLVSIFLAYISLNIYNECKNGAELSWFPVVSILVNLLCLTLFSATTKVFIVSLLFVFLWIFVLAFIFIKDKGISVKGKLKHMILPVVTLLLISLFQIESIQSLILNRNILSPLNLSLDFSWQITAQTLMSSLKNGILGPGLDSFGVAFTTFKPIDLININLTSSYNEILTSLSNSGFLWLVIWIVFGWYLIKDLVQDIRGYDRKYRAVILFDTVLLFIYLSSFLVTYTILLRILFFLLISVGVVLRNLAKQGEVDNVLLKIWSMGTSKKNKETAPILSICLTGVFCIGVTLGVIKLTRVTISSLYLLRAESYISAENEKFIDIEPTQKEEQEITDNLYRWYLKALKYDRKNPLVNRKFSIISVDKLNVLIDSYENTEDEEILKDAVDLRSNAFEYSRIAVNLSPSLYAGYNDRASVYLGIINLGYTEYIRDAISVIDDAIDINPFDYQNYYNKAQLYYLLQNYELAFEASTQALRIKGNYIPALVLSANINGIQGKTDIQLSYLSATKTILESNDLEDSQLYLDILEQIELISQAKDEEVELTNDTEDVPETGQ